MTGRAVPSVPADYFEELYTRSPDPWALQRGWYETRKRALTLALLPQPGYRSGYEPGCSIGLLTAELAARCEQLLATDTAQAAVGQARRRCVDHPHVRVERATLPWDWPQADFDLVVVSELGYYLGEREVAQLATRACAAAGTLAAVHWRHPAPEYPLDGDRVHAALRAAAATAGLTPLVELVEADLVAGVWARDPRSVAQREGLR